jgi:hypothetical protein
LHPAIVPSSAAVEGGNTGPTNELSPDSWSGHSSPHEISDVNASTPPQREPYEDDRPHPERSNMIVDDAIAGVDLQSDAEAHARPSSDVASAEAAVAAYSVIAAGLDVVNDSDAGMHDVEKPGG